MISIAMTTYNGERYLEKQINSLLEQTLKADEIIICDDCSTDQTEKILERYAEQNPCIHYIKNDTNLGYRKNFKKAVSLTQGDYIFLCDQDDEWHPDKLEQMLAIMKEKGCKALCSDYTLIDSDSCKLKKESFAIHPFIKQAKEDSLTPIVFSQLIFGNLLQGCTYCFTRDVKEKYLELSNEDVDHDQQIMFVATLLGDVYFYKKELIDYRIHSSNAIGISEKGSGEGLELKKPSRKPFMVIFLDELNDVIPVKNMNWYKILYYLRIPYLVSRAR